ncbi:UDP-N-acetylmuramoyl-L-alanyl-D-glutamate--2,6-diaminopimelate ligase [Desulfococcaceae bacterium OttesenSCG-928-F15]|nr:UDP-N-acetylmuramoyl-L-alanyl-D-glutamate--2,6-diaminopimelate ligase [Desulfococcaceae bacterium OttesenSCG-928-F15]
MRALDLFSQKYWPEGLPFQVKAFPDENPEISGIQYRSDRIRAGDIFVAVPGFSTDGHLFAEKAAKNGAILLVAERPVPEAGIPTILVDKSRKALSALSAAFFGFPGNDLVTIGITGTNGKTTTACLLKEILERAGHKTGLLGTLGWYYGDLHETTDNTTPESRDLQEKLARMRDAGITHLVMEVSSHAADLGRIEHIPFDLGVFTNLSQDHLDYHRTMEAYWECKRAFLLGVLDGKFGKKGSRLVLNIDDPKGENLLNECIAKTGGHRLLSTGSHPDAIVRAGDPRFSLEGIRMSLSMPEETIALFSPLVGSFNLENMLLASAAASALGISGEAVKEALEHPAPVPGRLERIEDPKGRFIFVDYAHTPDALEKALKVLRHLTKGKLFLVFGCGGNRDRGKRPLMGGIAAKYADSFIVTSDNPRKEEPLAIIEDIRSGIPVSAHYTVNPDRKSAIGEAISKMNAGDALLIAGKGHEPYQIIGETTFPFDDREVAREGIQAHG